MRSNLTILIIFTFVFSLSINPAKATIVESELARLALLDLKQVSKSLRKYLPKDSKILNKTRIFLSGGLKDKVPCNPTEIGFSLEDMNIVSSKITEKKCTDGNSDFRTIDLKFSHCTSPSDLECVCSHKEHKNEPRCAGFSDEKNENDKSKCIPESESDELKGRLDQIITDLISAFSVDSDVNGVSDICEDNL